MPAFALISYKDIAVVIHQCRLTVQKEIGTYLIGFMLTMSRTHSVFLLLIGVQPIHRSTNSLKYIHFTDYCVVVKKPRKEIVTILQLQCLLLMLIRKFLKRI